MSTITSLDSKHKEDLTKVATDALRKAMGVAIDELVETGVLHNGNIQRVRAQGDKIVSAVTSKVKEVVAELVENLVGCLKLISGAEKIILKATSGKKMLGTAKSIFAYIDGDFKNYGCNVEGSPTTEQSVVVYEMIKDATFAQIFGGFGENLDRLCLSQEQIIDFLTDHRRWLRTDGYGTFFLFKVGTEFFVAYVRVHSGGDLSVYVFRLGYDNVWHADYRHRVVVPQLTTLTPSL
jgi:hypothetical protein